MLTWRTDRSWCDGYVGVMLTCLELFVPVVLMFQSLPLSTGLLRGLVPAIGWSIVLHSGGHVGTGLAASGNGGGRAFEILPSEGAVASIYDFVVHDITGRERSLSEHRNRVMLIVNTASKCGFTPQYAGLEALYRDLKDRGLVVLGFPCNQFGAQEPGGAEEIASFCRLTYAVSFPMYAKIEVNGPAASPLYVWLKNEVPGVLGIKRIKWNFTKFLVDRNGRVAKRFAPSAKPEDLRSEIESLL